LSLILFAASLHCCEGLVGGEAAALASIVVVFEPLSMDPKRIVARTNEDKITASVFFH
jgi:hypothetical protein